MFKHLKSFRLFEGISSDYKEDLDILKDILSELNEEGDIEYEDELPDEDYEAEIEARAEEFARRRYGNHVS